MMRIGVLETTGIVNAEERKEAFRFVYVGLAMVLIGLIPVALFSGDSLLLPAYLYFTSLLSVILGLLFVIKAAVQIRDIQRRDDLWRSTKLQMNSLGVLRS